MQFHEPYPSKNLATKKIMQMLIITFLVQICNIGEILFDDGQLLMQCMIYEKDSNYLCNESLQNITFPLPVL